MVIQSRVCPRGQGREINSGQVSSSSLPWTGERWLRCCAAVPAGGISCVSPRVSPAPPPATHGLTPHAARSLPGAKVGVAGIPLSLSHNEGAELSLRGGGMVWIKETKNQREVSKNKNPPAPLRKATATRRRCEGTAAVRAQLETKRGRLAQGAKPRAPPLPSPRCWKSLARSRTRAPRPREAGRQEETGAQPAGGQGPRLPGLFPTRTAPQRPRAMRPPTAAPCPGRTLWSPWRSFLPLALALVLGVGHAQRYPVGRYEPADRDSSRLWRPGGSHPAAATAKVYSLFREQDAPVPGSPPAKVAQPGWGSARRSTETEARRPPRAQQPRRVRPPAQTWRSSPLGQQQFAPRARAAPALLSFGTQQRPGAASPTPPRRRLTGRNVCGGKCCPGWTTANGTSHCIKPVCQPPCQNRGSCSRPQLCVCRSGFRGARCEEVIPEEEFDPQNSRPAPRRSAEGSPNLRRSSPARESTAARPRPSPPQLPPARTLSERSQTQPSQQRVGLSRTIRLYPATQANGQLTSNALPVGPGLEQRDSAQQAAYPDRPTSPWGLNLTEKIKKIKIVFTPTICKQTCAHGHCANSCERGDTTTLYSQGGHGHDPKSGFRIYFCQIPCLNGGRCIGRDECWCPTNSTGKFCHLPTPKLDRELAERGSHHRAPLEGPLRRSTYTLPLSNQLSSVNPSLVKVHIHHPPEASVQVHQVARVRGGAEEAPEENSVETRPSLRLPASPGHSHQDSNSIPTRAGEAPRPLPPAAPRPRGLLGRCYLSAVNGQCANPLLELTAQEDCCGSVGAFWGVTLCAPCPPRPASPVIENGQLECPQGYKRLNLTHCQDINECLTLGLCEDSECVNTRGSYLCTCRPGLMLDPSRGRCVSDKAVSMQQGLCYRSVGPSACTLPLSQKITKQICCCSRVGKAWGSKCEECPPPGTESFREICPAGHGYTYSSSDIRLTVRKAEEEELARPSREQGSKSDGTLPKPVERQPLRAVTSTWQEAETIPDKGDSQVVQATASVTRVPAWVLEDATGRPTPPLPGPGIPGTWEEEPVTTPTNMLVTLGPPDIDRCAAGATNICGPGTCVNLPDGYRCLCGPGYRLHPSQAYCTDDNECLRDPCLGKGRCVNHVGSYSCLCYPGYTPDTSGTTQGCQDIDECEQPGTCHGGRCTNTEGSYHCECDQGYIMVRKGHCQDIDECGHPGTCPDGKCVNSPGSYICLACEEGYRGQSGSCVDVNECLTPGRCAHGRCSNLEGSFRCSCEQGYEVTSDGKSCQDVNECASRASCPTGLCLNTEGSFACSACESGYWVNEDGTACEDLDECAFPGVCPSGVCTNTAGSFSCRACDQGYRPSPQGHTCEDVDECEDLQSTCLGGECKNTPGSYQCLCPLGFQLANGTVCEDVNECMGEEYCAPHGECLNSHGSFFCLCAPGFVSAEGGASCQDIDECENDGGDPVCGAWRCENSPGSYRCVLGCQPGFHMAPTGDCIDIDECANDTVCGSHGFCDNTEGSFHCLCDQGFETSSSNWDCVDVNECELMLAVCGAALCENVEGSFLCLCASDLEEYDAQEGRCRPRVAGGQSVPEAPPGDHLSGPLRMECYAGPRGQPPCASLLGRNTTKAECCCTQGASWGDACEPCPARDSVEFSEICPSGKGYVPVEGAWMFGQTTYTDADECTMFGPGLCQNGRCLNTVPGYICLCNPGYHYDATGRKCEDHDECQDMACENGECVNTEGSFHCFCSPPLTLDLSQQRCVNSTGGMEDLPDHDIHMDICWKKVTNYVCSQPLHGHRTTYTECCCQDGEAWSQQCALCPPRSSEVYAQLCNVARIEAEREAGVHFRPGYEYGPGPDDLQYSLYGPDGAPFYNYLGPEDAVPEQPFPNTASHPGDHAPGPESPLQPSELQPHYVASHPEHQAGFEGLQAEECGVLNGCENGRCVRVREGYTCDCFDGFQLDMAQMACVDVNECNDLNGPAALCAHGHCENTEGSYRCHCPPGFVAEAGPPRCTAKE
ncbi:latent-transforming growth factor beta-binding protein 2 isoform X2 [Desmodus rotundus]|uniref:latent-transforming growth factor beta-binding protein 2 isoform X2 n=1 Tax=Desmodus rotundus TaxID=9430 RepID=UPI0023813056|nr:latent-transforming growth factor beta-binding protein 2 isoform X2 [Desmodus rotundus]